MRYDNESRRRRHHPEGSGPEFGGPRGHDEGHSPDHDHGPRRGGRGHREVQHEGHGPGGFRRGGPGGRGRAQRGDVRAATLLLLGEQPMHGYQLMQAMAERTNGIWRPSPGAIYPTIAQLEDEGLVTTLAEGGRKLVTLTDAGRAYLTDNAHKAGSPADPFAALVDGQGQRPDLRSAVEEVHAATRAVGRTGTEAQVGTAFGILNDARRALYLLLAEGPAPAEPAA